MKKTSDHGFFDDGIFLQFDDQAERPVHIHVEVQSGSQELETCDIRLTTLEKKEEIKEESHEGVTVDNRRLEDTVDLSTRASDDTLTEEETKELKQ